MAVILFPTRKEVERFCNSFFRGSVLCPESMCRGIRPQGELSSIENEVLSEIQKTVLRVNSRVEELIKECAFSEILSAFSYENSYTNWRDRSHFIRLSLEAINKEIDEDVLSIMALIEIFYLSWLLADEELDETGKCEERESWYVKNGKWTGVIGSEIIFGLAAKSFKKIVKNKKLDVNTLQRMWEIFTDMWDRARYGFYKDMRATVDNLEELKNIECGLEESEYFHRIELLWGSHFEGGIKLALVIFPETTQEKIEWMGRLGRLWGKMLKLRDDIVDMVGDKHGLGREPMEDIKIDSNSIRIKKTLPVIRYLCNVKMNRKLNEILKVPNQEDFLKFQDEWQKAIEYSVRRLQDIASEIIGLLGKLPDTDAKNSLMKLVSLASTVRY